MPNFILPSLAFAKALSQVTPVVANNPLVPVLSNVLLTASGGTLTLRCSNLESDLTATVAVECREDFEAAVPAKALLGLLRGMPDAPLTCAWNENTYGFELRVGKGKYKLTGETPADYPRGRKPQAEAVALTMPTAALRVALLAALPAVSTDELRPAMCGVFVEAEADALRLTATDGHRLVLWVQPADNAEGITWTGTGSFIVPRGAVALLTGLLDAKSDAPATLLFDAANVRLHDGRWVTRLVDERFPDYRSVVPVRNPNVALFDRDELLGTLRRLEQLANDKTKQLRLRFTSSDVMQSTDLIASAEDLDCSTEGSEVLGCDYDGQDMEIGFNAAFLTQSLGLLPAGQVRLSMSTPDRAGLFTSADEPAEAAGLTYLVMPVQLNQYV